MITKLLFVFFLFSSIILTYGQLSNVNDTVAKEVLKLAFNLPDDPPTNFNLQRAALNDLIQPQKALTIQQLSYLKIQEFAVKNNLPTKVLIRKNDNKLFLIINSPGTQVSLAEVSSTLKDKLFDSNKTILFVNSSFLKGIPQGNPLNEDSKLVMLKDEDIVFLESQGFKYPIIEEDFKNFGFSTFKVEQVDEQHLISLRNLNPLK